MRQADGEQARGGHYSKFSNSETYPFTWPDSADGIAGSELWCLPSDALDALPLLKQAPFPDMHPVRLAHRTGHERASQRLAASNSASNADCGAFGRSSLKTIGI